jgi:hypothetical protein
MAKKLKTISYTVVFGNLFMLHIMVGEGAVKSEPQRDTVLLKTAAPCGTLCKTGKNTVLICWNNPRIRKSTVYQKFSDFRY